MISRLSNSLLDDDARTFIRKGASVYLNTVVKRYPMSRYSMPMILTTRRMKSEKYSLGAKQISNGSDKAYKIVPEHHGISQRDNRKENNEKVVESIVVAFPSMSNL